MSFTIGNLLPQLESSNLTMGAGQRNTYALWNKNSHALLVSTGTGSSLPSQYDASARPISAQTYRPQAH